MKYERPPVGAGGRLMSCGLAINSTVPSEAQAAEEASCCLGG